MNINVFFSLLFLGLAMIFVLFKPLNLKEQSFADVPIFELDFFTLHELDIFGLSTLMTGDGSVKYDDRYLVTNIDYTDNSREYIANMKADEGLYKDDAVALDGDITYIREDGLTFKADRAVYDKKTEIIQTDSEFTSFRSSNAINGSSLKYHNDSQKIEAKNVTIKYQLKESP